LRERLVGDMSSTIERTPRTQRVNNVKRTYMLVCR